MSRLKEPQLILTDPKAAAYILSSHPTKYVRPLGDRIVLETIVSTSSRQCFSSIDTGLVWPWRIVLWRWDVFQSLKRYNNLLMRRRWTQAHAEDSEWSLPVRVASFRCSVSHVDDLKITVHQRCISCIIWTCLASKLSHHFLIVLSGIFDDCYSLKMSGTHELKKTVANQSLSTSQMPLQF